MNANPEVHGILVQLPLPPQIDEDVILKHIYAHKDVDGLHPLNVAQLANTKTHNRVASDNVNDSFFDSLHYHVACTPQGCIELLDRYNVDIEGIFNDVLLLLYFNNSNNSYNCKQFILYFTIFKHYYYYIRKGSSCDWEV